MNWKYFWVAIGFLAILIFTIWLITSPALYSGFDYHETGNIGDTIGGITAPIIGIIGAYLVYRSFEAQLDANRIQTDALKEDREKAAAQQWLLVHLQILSDIKSDLKNFDFDLPVSLVDGKSIWACEKVNYRSMHAFVLLPTVYTSEDTEINLKIVQNAFAEAAITRLHLIFVEFQQLIYVVKMRKDYYPFEVEMLIEQILKFYQFGIKPAIKPLIQSLDKSHSISVLYEEFEIDYFILDEMRKEIHLSKRVKPS